MYKCQDAVEPDMTIDGVEKICGTCRWWWKVSGYWDCNNEESEFFSEDLDYRDGCEAWELKFSVKGVNA
jgi:hypothetical protein